MEVSEQGGGVRISGNIEYQACRRILDQLDQFQSVTGSVTFQSRIYFHSLSFIASLSALISLFHALADFVCLGFWKLSFLSRLLNFPVWLLIYKQISTNPVSRFM